MSSYKFNFKNKAEDVIITDAGWQNLSYEDALKYFTKEEISDFWQKYIEDLEIDEIASELDIDMPILDTQSIEYEDFLDDIYKRMPTNISVIVAKATYKEYKLISIISLPDFEQNFSKYESYSILLGLLLQKKLGKKIEIINDCKNAVLELRQKYNLSSILWARRNHTKKAHNLKIENSSKVIEKRNLSIHNIIEV